jgi:hypothetical protein
MIIDREPVYYPIFDEIVQVICNLDNLQTIEYFINKLKSMKQAY